MANYDILYSAPLMVGKRQVRNGHLREIEEEANLLVSPKFCSPLWLVKAREILDGVKGQMSEPSYKAYVLVLNAQIVERITNITGSVSNSVGSLIKAFDMAVKESEGMARTPSLDHFQAYARCLLLQRIGDHLLSRQSRVKEGGGRERDVTLGLASYILALDVVQRASPVTPRLAAVCATEMLILRTILVNAPSLGAAKKLAADKQIGERLFSAIQKPFNNALSFVWSVTPCAFSDIGDSSVEHFAAKIWPTSEGPMFLQTLIWLLAFNKPLLTSSLSFMNSFLSSLPDEPDCSNMRTIDEASLSRKDVKVLLIACARWVQLEWETSTSRRPRELPVPPPALFISLPIGVVKFWNALLIRLDPTKKLNAATLVAISNGLELTRLRAAIPDLRVVDTMRRWLVLHGDEQHCWARHCTSIALGLITGAVSSTSKGSRNDGVLPGSINQAIPTALEDEIYAAASTYLEGHRCSNGDRVTEVYAEAPKEPAANKQKDKVVESSGSNGTNGVDKVDKGADTEEECDKSGVSGETERKATLMERLEVASRLIRDGMENTVHLSKHRRYLDLRQFLELKEAINGSDKNNIKVNSKLTAWLAGGGKGSSLNDRLPSADWKDDWLNDLQNREESRSKRADNLVETILQMFEKQSIATPAVPSQQADVWPAATPVNMNGASAGWTFAEHDFASTHQQPSIAVPRSVLHNIQPTNWTNYQAHTITVPQPSGDTTQSVHAAHTPSALNNGAEEKPHDPRLCLGCADDEAQDRLFHVLDSLAENCQS